MGPFSPRADCRGMFSAGPSAGSPDTVAKWRTRCFRAVNSFDIVGYGVGRVRQPSKQRGELANHFGRQFRLAPKACLDAPARKSLAPGMVQDRPKGSNAIDLLPFGAFALPQ